MKEEWRSRWPPGQKIEKSRYLMLKQARDGGAVSLAEMVLDDMNLPVEKKCEVLARTLDNLVSTCERKAANLTGEEKKRLLETARFQRGLAEQVRAGDYEAPDRAFREALRQSRGQGWTC